MEKRAVVEPGRTRDTELRAGEKRAGEQSRQQQTDALDDDFMKRAAEQTQNQLKKTGS